MITQKNFDDLEVCKKDFLTKIQSIQNGLKELKTSSPNLDKLSGLIDLAIKEAKDKSNTATKIK